MLVSEKDLNKAIISAYSSTVIPVCKLLKPHATNIMLLPNNLVLMQASINGIRNYMVLNRDIDTSKFIYTYTSLIDISKINSKFRKTKSAITWEVNDGTNYLVVANDDMEPFKTPVINNPATVADLLNATYKNIPNWSSNNICDILCDEPNLMYTKLPDKFIEDIVAKKLCDLTINGNTILISRPFLGDLKKTSYVGYRVISEIDGKIVIKFKQTEDIGNIYTYAAFLTM